MIDGRIDDGAWMTTAFDDSTWPFAVAINGNQWGKMYPREIPLAREIVLDQLTMLPSGTPINKVLPIELTAGKEMLVDFGAMAMAYTSMELDADEGSELRMQYALQYKEGKPVEMYGVGNRYTARSGKQSLITTDQWDSRYMLVKCLSRRIKIDAIRIVDRRYPFERLGSFNCNEQFLNKLWEMAVHTIEVYSWRQRIATIIEIIFSVG